VVSERTGRRVEAEAAPDPVETAEPASPPPRRRGLRPILLVVVPLVVIVGGALLYMSGGRYVDTDNAYVGASMVLITSQVTGPVDKVFVHEGQHITAGQPLFEIDPAPYRSALAAAQAVRDGVRIELASLKQQYQQSLSDIANAKIQVAYQQTNYERIAKLASHQFSAKADLDKAKLGLDTAKAQLASAQVGAQSVLAKLSGNADLPLAQFPDYMKAEAALADAQRNLAHTVIRAPIAGIATQTDNASPAMPNVVSGKFMTPGALAMAVVSDKNMWVDANPKETEIANIKAGDPATIVVDAYPGHTFKGHVASISPGTGSQFSLLPAQNASGNWIKVGQRVPVRVVIDDQPGDPVLRAGMSANVSIDTGTPSMLSRLF
jgi:membrane fusion protein (multidrug efflux system)